MSRIYDALKKAEQDRAAARGCLSRSAYASPVANPMPNGSCAIGLVSKFRALGDEVAAATTLIVANSSQNGKP